jgi:hypothetical protein
MTVEELTALQQSIEEFGQRDPIVVFEGMVLDGWHRWTCCQRLGIAAKLVDLPAGVNPRAFVKDKNLHRRHLNASQRALAVVACNEWQPAGNPRNMEPGSTLPATNASMAKEADVSTKTIQQAKVVTEQATPEVREAVKSGDMSLKAAVETTKPTVATPIPVTTSGPATVITLDPAASVQLDPSPTPALAPAPAPAGEMTLQQQYDSLVEQFNEQGQMLKETIAENAKMGAVFDADDHLKAALGRIKQLEAENETQRTRIAGLQSEKNQAIDAAKRWKRKAEGK